MERVESCPVVVDKGDRGEGGKVVDRLSMVTVPD